MQAVIEIHRRNPGKALEFLRQFDSGHLANEDDLGAAYFGGLAYLQQKSGKEAAAQFQRILVERSLDPFSSIHPLAQLGLGRALVVASETSEARTAYQDFFVLWKDADPDIPILKQAKAEYAKLQ